MNILIKRAYDAPNKNDGYRVLVDRLWPRGLKKEELDLDEWCKDVAPSNELRTWFGHDPAKFQEFKKRYEDELKNSNKAQKLLERAGKNSTLTLIYSAKDPEKNQAIVLRDYLKSLVK